MKKLLVVILCVIIVMSFAPAIVKASNQSDQKQRVIVGFKNQANPEIIRGLSGEIHHIFNDISAIATSLPQNAIDNLIKNPNIAYIEPDAQVKATGEVLPWGVDRIDDGNDLVLVHQYNKGTGVKVAIIDTGMYYTHEDLDANYAGGYNFVNNNNDPMDDNGHGTHVAGTIAAESGNDIGVIGVAPQASLYALKALDSSGSGYISNIIAAINWARGNGIKIISMSLGSNYDSTSLHQTCDLAYSQGILLVAAAGNDYMKIGRNERDTVDYPARYSSVIAVGATDEFDQKASFSSTGTTVELAAPGVNIPSTFPPTIAINGQTGYYYAIGSGTSMACPHVSGAAALVWSGEPSLTVDQVRQRLKSTADDLGNTGVDNWFGYGIVDIDQAAPPTGPILNQPPVANAGPDQTVTADTSGTALVTLDGSASSDPEGKALIYLWSEGGTSLGSGERLMYSFGVGTHIVTLTVTDVEGATASDTVTINVNQYQPLIQIHVANIDMAMVSKGGGKIVYATATITVKDKNDNPVEGVIVSGHWEGATVDSDSGLTSSSGQVTLTSDSLKKPSGTQTFTFVVDDLSKDGYQYESSANNENRDSVNYP